MGTPGHRAEGPGVLRSCETALVVAVLLSECGHVLPKPWRCTWGHGLMMAWVVLSCWLDSMILEVFFHLYDSVVLWWQCGTSSRTGASWGTLNWWPHPFGHCGATDEASGVIQTSLGLFLDLVWAPWGCPMPGQELDFDDPYGSLPTRNIL